MMNNSKILVVDDEEIVRDGIRDILTPAAESQSGLEDASSDLFDETPITVKHYKNKYLPDFKLDEADNGKKAVELVKRSIQKNEPYAVIFLDMRMPGWDGLETAIKIRKVDLKVQIFFVTAYSDRSIEEIISQVGGDVGYLNKPFNSDEILQLATKGVYDWSRLTNLEKLLENIGHIGQGNMHLNNLLINILHQIADYVGTDYAVLGKIDSDYEFEDIAKVGIGEKRLKIKELFKQIDISEIKKVELTNGVLIFPLKQYCILAIPADGDKFNQEKIYLLHLFVENAVRAIKNSELSDELVKKEKLSAIGEAISMVMHDIRTPIGQIQSMAEMIKEMPEDKENSIEMSDMILEATKNGMEIIQDVMDFVRDKEIEKKEIELKSFLEDIVKQLKHNYKDTKFSIELEMKENPTVKGDARKLKRVIGNLINNAYEAMEAQDIEHKSVKVLAENMDSKIVLTVADNGPGIPQKIIKKLFQPFVTSGKAGGSGLGLAIVEQIIKAHDGTIKAKSSEQGATFIIQLPK